MSRRGIQFLVVAWLSGAEAGRAAHPSLRTIRGEIAADKSECACLTGALVVLGALVVAVVALLARSVWLKITTLVAPAHSWSRSFSMFG